MVTRRDGFLAALDEATAAARSSMAPPPGQGQQQRSQTAVENVGSQLQRGLTGLEAGITTLMRSGTNASPAASYQRRPSNVAQSPAAGPSQPAVGPSSPPLNSIRTGPPDPAEGEDLPGYSRRPPQQAPSVPPNMRGNAFHGLPVQEHRLASRNGKIECAIESVGRGAVPVFIRDLADVVRGEVTVRLEKPEPISAIRIRLKVVVRTVVNRAPGGAQHRHPIIDEHLILELAETVWEAPPGQAETARLQGVHSFPYEFRLPEALRYGNQTLELPPSFALSVNEYMTGTHEVASVKYYLKATLARQGLFRQNDRLFAPVLMLQRHERPRVPFERAAAIDGLPGHRSVPGPAFEPSSWQGRHASRELRKGGVFSAKTRDTIEATLLLPLPHVYGTRTPIPFCLRVTCTDPSRLPPPTKPGPIRIDLVQRTNLVAQGLDAIYETIVGSSTDVSADPDGGGAGNERRYRGTIVATPARTPGFVAVGLQVSHAVTAVIGDLAVVVPVTVQAWPPLRQPSSAGSPAPVSSVEEAESAAPPDLPPSYFEVVETSDRKR